MSKYTAMLREWFDQYQDGTKKSRDLIEAGRTTLFDFDYPIFDEAYKNVFETHFIRKFYMREIGFETFGLFKFQLETWLLINMPYFNKLFESELLEYDPLINSKMDTSYTKTNDKKQTDETTSNGNRTSEADSTQNAKTSGTKTGTTNGSSDSNTNQSSDSTSNETKSEDSSISEDDFERQLESDNPDTRLALTANDGQGVIEYASKIKEQNNNKDKTQSSNGNSNSTSNTTEQVTNTQNTQATSTETDNANTDQSSNTNINETDTRNDTLNSTINDVEDYIQHRVGKIGVQSYPKLVQEYRQSLLRIEATIFNEMNELFMLVY